MKDTKGQGPDETSIHKEITDAMITAGVAAYADWKERRKMDAALSRVDLITAIYVAMRRRQKDNEEKLAV